MAAVKTVIVKPQPNATRYWRCLNCGQVYFGDCPPDDLCPFCNDLTTWTQHVYAVNGSMPHASHNSLPASPDADTLPSRDNQQLPLFRDDQ